MKRVAAVIGGGGALGSAICHALGEAGLRIAVIDINLLRAQQCADLLVERGFSSAPIAGDISRKSDAERIKDEVKAYFGRTDVLVNAQGTLHNELLFKLTENGWKDTMTSHVEGTLNSMMAFAPVMKEQGYGRIINMSSIAVLGAVGGASYSAAKGAIEGLSRTAALEWARYGITVNCVAPGLIEAGMFLTTPEKFRQAGIDKTPMKRAGKPEEVAACVRFLASEEAGFITGQTIFICGGLSIGY